MTHTQRTLLRAALAVCVLLALCISPAVASGYSARINNSGAKIYARSGKSGSLPAGTTVSVQMVSQGWAQISYKGATGYVQLKYLTAKNGATGYISKATGLYKSASSSSTKLGNLSRGAKLQVVGVNGGYYQVTNGSVYGYVAKGCVSKTKPAPSASSWKSKVQLAYWFDGGSEIIDKGDYGYIYDIASGLTIRVRCMYGTNHADLEPVTKEDTLKLLKMSGGSFSWDSRAVILKANGKYVAAAINTMPHGEQTIADNGYNGQFCLHMVGSKTHGSDSVNEAHQEAIQKAYKWARG